MIFIKGTNPGKEHGKDTVGWTGAREAARVSLMRARRNHEGQWVWTALGVPLFTATKAGEVSPGLLGERQRQERSTDMCKGRALGEPRGTW